jgi:ubiquinone/menaquinone biosynthesis C-methylase UbiE
MSSAWLNTDLEAYESHIEFESVGQGAAIRRAIAAFLSEHNPASFLYLGCAGGNGLEAARQCRLLAVDLNASYIERARQRWPEFAADQFVVWDLNEGIPGEDTFEAAFGALLFEYIADVPLLLERLAARVRGRLLVLVLATRENAPAVVESPYRKLLEPVGREFRYLSAEQFVREAEKCGLGLERIGEIPLPSGKHFVSILFRTRLS